ncbi:3-isopropylmalate dehydratase large subunit [Gallalistipes aquisgranensis]|uniref:3-isopropylmalate dehydratase large subunit n=1 Tax=Gallalistipes aquisgranensis TaxID=2779358 RepID=UPI001CF8B0F8|nr:3-isopropylmalate dehydratase large subunit [Gallalistipes aquisgranensis]MBE5032337.1 3-isopropylmalate dehydratase large subunit [Gallalistipes aquisgranensis]
MGKTLFDKVWDAHVVRQLDGGRSVLYIDRHYIHEVTSPVAFLGLRNRGIKVARPAQTTATADHNVPTVNRHLPIEDPLSRGQLEAFEKNCAENGIEHFGLHHPKQGVVHIVGPELGFTQPGMTIVCGDSHTSTHGAFGAVAFGIGTSEVEMVFASQCILQPKPKTMRITVNGQLGRGVTSKDVILYIISKISASGGTGHFIEFAGEAIRSMSMEARMTVCNMSIECGARGGMIAPDQTTFDYVRGRENAPKGADFDRAVERWKELYSDPDARFDTEYTFDAADIEPMITYGTNPGMGVGITGRIPTAEGLSGSDRVSFDKALEYMDFKPGDAMLGKRVDYVFVGSCTNGRIEDFRLFAEAVKGRRKADNVTAWIVPGSRAVEAQCKAEGLDKVLKEAGFELREPGCSACLAMNADKIPAGMYSVSTSNRNFEGRQGPGARTLLAGPLVAAAAAVSGVIADPRELFNL